MVLWGNTKDLGFIMNSRSFSVLVRNEFIKNIKICMKLDY